MSGRVTLSTSAKGAFRVEVAGMRPDNVTRLILTGQGDERELELPAGAYTADVTNIGTGVRQSIDFRVDEVELLLKIGGDRTRSTNWRSASGQGRAPKGWKATGPTDSVSDDVRALSLPSLRSYTRSGWRTFSGTVLVNEDLRHTLKVGRSGTWAAAPLLRIDFPRSDQGVVHVVAPLFSGGTLVRWTDEDQRPIEIKPCEPKSAAIVGSLTGSVHEELPQILQWAAGSDEAEAVLHVMNSRDDPWIAAATGLLLVGAARLKQSASSLARLAARNAWMADLGVLAAWARAVDAPNDAEDCLRLITRSREGGVVYFWQTCTIADRLLTALSSGSRSPAIRSRARKELGLWRRHHANAFKVGAFLAWSASK